MPTFGRLRMPRVHLPPWLQNRPPTHVAPVQRCLARPWVAWVRFFPRKFQHVPFVVRNSVSVRVIHSTLQNSEVRASECGPPLSRRVAGERGVPADNNLAGGLAVGLVADQRRETMDRNRLGLATISSFGLVRLALALMPNVVQDRSLHDRLRRSDP